MKTILCPTDFSLNSEQAVKYAASLADSFHNRLVILHAIETPAVFTEVPFTSIKVSENVMLELAGQKLQVLKSKLTKQYPSLTIETNVAVGLTHERIVDAADQNGAEFIVMGTTGTSKLERMLMGSTTAKVIGRANCPVLCIPKTATFKGIRKIVFATDMHEDNLESARHIGLFARHFDAEIIFIFVDDKHLVHSEERIERMTKKIRSRIKYPKISGYIVSSNSIISGIEKFLKKYPADALVMFSHEKHFPGTMFSQSITKLMSHQARIPLLALKLSTESLLKE